MARGKPNCPACRGSGVTQTAHGRAVCGCVRGTQLQRDLQHYMNRPAGHTCDTCRRALAYLTREHGHV